MTCSYLASIAGLPVVTGLSISSQFRWPVSLYFVHSIYLQRIDSVGLFFKTFVIIRPAAPVITLITLVSSFCIQKYPTLVVPVM